MTQIADHISVRPACTCNDPSTTSSSSDSLYASVMAPSQLIVANSAAEYSSKAKINVSPDVMFTIDEARQYIAQKAGKTIDALHPSTLIPQELCTRTADGKDASTVRQNQIRKMLREVCVVIETLPDKREEEDGMIKTRGIQYFRDNYRTIFDRLVDKLEVAIPELQLCAGHWKALQLISRRLKSFSEKDTRRNKFIEKQKLKHQPLRRQSLQQPLQTFSSANPSLDAGIALPTGAVALYMHSLSSPASALWLSLRRVLSPVTRVLWLVGHFKSEAIRDPLSTNQHRPPSRQTAARNNSIAIDSAESIARVLTAAHEDVKEHLLSVQNKFEEECDQLRKRLGQEIDYAHSSMKARIGKELMFANAEIGRKLEWTTLAVDATLQQALNTTRNGMQEAIDGLGECGSVL
ncbi:unnamed protein product [Tilletia caries]|uniref:Uncharacterized protein n=1 Tax=Tilletia caries TaxID=13290 RepID=A0ABN7J347_9BASI|nr:unnamed protein product [Tilletia caries]